MPAGEALFVTLASAVTKALVKCWVGDNELLTDTASTLGELLGRAGLNQRDRRRAARQLEGIGERIADRLEPFFASEQPGGLPDNERTAAIIAVANTVDQGFSSPHVALTADLDPRELERRLRAQSPRAVQDAGLSQLAIRLYDFTLAECCAYLVQMVGELPPFNRLAFAELLARTNNLEQMLSVALDALPQARADGIADFETRYRRAVVHELDWMRLVGLKASQPSRRYALSVAYISLLVSADDLDDEEPWDWEDWDEPAEPRDDVVRVEELVHRHRRLLLTGPAGSGKTTILQWLAVRAATTSFRAELRDLNGHVPLFVHLRRFARAELPRPRQLIDEVSRSIADLVPDGWVERALDDGAALVLVDGVDELPHDRREAVTRWLDDLCQAFPSAGYVVTARPAATDGWDPPAGFATGELMPMSPKDVDAFIDHWHRAASHNLLDSEESEDLASFAARLKRIVREQSPLRRLATNPLMCAVLCAVHRENRAILPHSRIELYESALDMLLEHRDPRRGVVIEDVPLSRTQKHLLLEDLAWWLITNGYSDAPRDVAERRIEHLLERIDSKLDPAVVLRFLLERTGLLREPVVGRVDFIHKTFLEYLAARDAVAHQNMGVLVRHGHEDAYQEVITLAAGVADSRQRDALVGGLLERAERESEREPQLVLLAAACVDVAPDLDPKVRATAQQRLEQLVPPRSMRDAERLAWAGEVAVPLLAYTPGMLALHARASIRTLSRIGTEGAMLQLAPYAADERRSVVDGLIDAWRSFDAVAYARTVLQDCRFEQVLSLFNVEDLSFLPPLRGLKRLSLAGSRGRIDERSLADMTAPRELAIEAVYGLSSLVALAQMTDLRRLVLRDVDDLETLDGLQLLELASLEIVTAPSLSSVDALRMAPSTLRRLRLARTNVVDLAPLQNQTTLETLDLTMDYIDTLEPLASLPSLRELVLRGASNDLDLQWLTLCPALARLELVRCNGELLFAPFGTVAPLAQLTLDRCLFATSLRDLGELGTVRSLRLARLQLPTLNGLDELCASSDLRELVIEGCPVWQLTGIPEAVERLSLSSTSATDLAPLAELPHLRELRLEQTPITSLDALADCAALERVTLGPLAQLTDLSALTRMPSLSVVDPGPRWQQVQLLDLPEHVAVRSDRTRDEPDPSAQAA